MDHNGRIALKLPVRTADGTLAIHNTPAQFDRTLHIGYLPYSTNTVIQQAFLFMGDVYGWGGLEDSVDCSAFVQDVYRSMGIHIPRDADQQELAMPVQTDNPAKARSGALIFKPGHVMLYLGLDPNGNPMVIHASSAYQQVMVARLSDVTSQISSVGSLR
jgi:cell wall-associated NlpC family hydrolase